MLKGIMKTISVTSGSCIEEKEIIGFSANVDSDSPARMSLSTWVNDEKLYKENIAQCRADEDEFRKYARALQDKLFGEEENEE